jgi:tRNA(fMet)-specific endonuclease VapC
MAEFMLDTDTVSWALRGQGAVAGRLLAHRPSELCVSSITLAELRFGADAKASRKLHALIDTFVASVNVLPFDQTAADHFGPAANALARRGEPIGTFDTLIAAHALSRGATLVTNNVKHFRRVARLKTQNWA